MSASLDERRTLIAVGAIILAGGVAGILWGRGEPGPGETDAARVRVARVATPAADGTARIVAAVPPPAAIEPSIAALDEAELARLAEDSMSGPAASRVAAFERLAKAPRDQALPLLERVLLNGDPAVDRPAALRSLLELALAQGDGDQRIRDSVREVIYHGDDADFAAQAQQALDLIERSAPGGS